MFAKDFKIRYYEIDSQRTATPVSLLNFMVETAICHSEAAECGLDVLHSLGTAWVLARWSIDILRYPLWGERIKVETQPTRSDRFYAWREYSIKNSGGECLVKASSLWIYINLGKRRPSKVPAEFMERFGANHSEEQQCSFDLLTGPGEDGSIYPFHVRRGDIDTNNHVFNSQYLGWFLEAVPEEIHANQYLSSLQIDYRKEIKLGLQIISKAKSSTDSDTNHTIVDHCILSADEQTTHAVARTFWKPRL